MSFIRIPIGKGLETIVDADAPESVINRDRLDNRRANLRIATTSQNNANRGVQVNNTSGYKGVRLVYGKYWVAQIKLDGHFKHLGSFQTPEDAARAYDVARLAASGEFAVLNFPEDAK